MERNTILAIVLSALVLFAYQAFFPAPKQKEPIIGTQSVGTNNLTTNIISPTGITPIYQSETTNTVIKPKIYEIKTKLSDISYSNVGGTLHNVNFKGNSPFPLTGILSINGFDNAQYAGQKIDDRTVSLSYEDKNWQITKIYELNNDNSIKVRMEIKNVSGISILNNFNFKAFEIDVSKLDNVQNNRENGLYEYSVDANNVIFRKDSAYKFSDKNNKIQMAKVNWVGFRDHYQALIIKPAFETKGYAVKTDSDKQLSVSIDSQDKNLAPGESAEYDFTIYMGPQDPWLMKKYGDDFDKIIVFSKYAIYKWPAEGVYYAIAFLHGIVRSWGIAIVLMGIIFYSLTYPLTMQSMMSMRKLQEVSPKIKAIQEKYKNDPQKQQAETMEIYRREKINPMGGCLPVLIQMPFFYAIVQVMYRAQYFQGQGFLWIKDLSQPDQLINFSYNLPIIGNELNILPILSGCLMFLQQKLSSKNMVIADEQQAMQQKMTMYMMPALMAWMFYRFTSGWGVYFVTYYILSTATQWQISQKSGKK